LIDGHNPDDYARAVATLADDDSRRDELSRGAVAHAATFGWERTTAGLLDTYRAAIDDQRLAELVATT
jgi:D-inositol-3-phosphate glycosyltransferase